jgi:hypothetical protein
MGTPYNAAASVSNQNLSTPYNQATQSTPYNSAANPSVQGTPYNSAANPPAQGTPYNPGLNSQLQGTPYSAASIAPYGQDARNSPAPTGYPGSVPPNSYTPTPSSSQQQYGSNSNLNAAPSNQFGQGLQSDPNSSGKHFLFNIFMGFMANLRCTFAIKLFLHLDRVEE